MSLAKYFKSVVIKGLCLNERSKISFGLAVGLMLAGGGTRSTDDRLRKMEDGSASLNPDVIPGHMGF